MAPSSWATATMAGRSATSSIGLVGDSAQSRSAPRSAAVTAAGSLISTRRAGLRPEPGGAGQCGGESRGVTYIAPPYGHPAGLREVLEDHSGAVVGVRRR